MHVAVIHFYGLQNIKKPLIKVLYEQRENVLMQVTANLAQDPHCIIIIPKEKKIQICQTAHGCTVTDELHCVTYISSWESQTTVFLLWLTPQNHTWYFHREAVRVEIPHSFSAPCLPWGLILCSFKCLNIFHRCSKRHGVCYTGGYSFSQLSTSTVTVTLWSPGTDKKVVKLFKTSRKNITEYIINIYIYTHTHKAMQLKLTFNI